MVSDNKIPIIIIVAALLAAVFFYSSAQSVPEELIQVQAEKDSSDARINRYSELIENYGRASDFSFADKPVIILHGKDSSETFRIYFEKKAGEKKPDGSVNYDHDDLDMSWEIHEDGWLDITVTAKTDIGCYNVRFTNDFNDDSFNLLVIVRDDEENN